jgi:CPA2 family monovalent cation:H+ antiporter-2
MQRMQIHFLVVEADSTRIEEVTKQGAHALYGDAANSEVLTHAGLDHARALVVAGPDESSSELVVAAARDIAPKLPIIARASTTDGVQRLLRLGAQHVIHPELEGGLEIVRYTLLQLGFPLGEIYRYKDAVRKDNYDLEINTESEHRILQDLIDAANRVEIVWLPLPQGNPISGQTLESANLRARTGASVIAIIRDDEVLANPKSSTTFETGDRIGFIGDNAQIDAVKNLLSPTNIDDVSE